MVNVVVVFSSIRVVACTDVRFTREVEDGLQRVVAHFSSHPQLVTAANEFDVQQLANDLNVAADEFNARGSGFVFDRVTRFTLIITKFKPLGGSSFVPTPPHIAKKHAVVNVQNDDERCFEYAILSAIHPAEYHGDRASNYVKYRGTLNFEGISFPVEVKQITKFEQLNPDVSVNVILIDDDHNGFCVEYLCAERNRPHHVNLLLLSDTDTGARHYVWIKNFSRLLGDRTKHHPQSYVCNSCLNVFSSQQVLENHVPYCLMQSPQHVVYPSKDSDKCKLRFRDVDKQHPLNFYLVCDFESFLIPSDRNPDDDDYDLKTIMIDRHEPSGFCCYRVTDLEEHKVPPTVYSGVNVMDTFYDHVMSESDKFNKILSKQTSMAAMTKDELSRHELANKCENCRCAFTHEN